MEVFYRKYRPQKLDQILGQEHIVKTLISQLESGKIQHGYLFAGPKGSGKTSLARIFAKAVNCQVYSPRSMAFSKKKEGSSQNAVVSRHLFGEPCNKCASCLAITDGSYLDLIEIDAASNRGIDEIRDLREKIKLTPISARFKVYIIDEVHMLTTEAFNALLKTLEEPPGHAIFILCTTEASKLPPTIISRLSRFNFTRATNEALVRSIEKVAKAEGISITKQATLAIATSADGSFRDAVSILNQLSTSRAIEEIDVKNLIKIGGVLELFQFVENLAAGRVKEAIEAVESLAKVGADISLFAKKVVLFVEKLLLIKIGISLMMEDDFDSQSVAKVRQLAQRISYQDIQKLMKLFLVAESETKLYPLPQISLVLAICKYCPDPAGELKEQDIKAGESVQKKTQKVKLATRVKKGDQSVKMRKKSHFSLSEVERHWGEFLNKVKPVNAHVVALLRATRLASFDGENLVMEVFYRFHKEKLEEPKIIRVLDEVMGEIMKRRVRLKFVLASRGSRPPRIVQVSDLREVAGDEFGELERVAQEIFSK